MKFCPRCGAVLDFEETESKWNAGVLHVNGEGHCPNGHEWVIIISSTSPGVSRAQMFEKPGSQDAPHVAIRPEVLWFAEQMERKLAVNDWRPGWKNCYPDWLILRSREEIGEIEAAMVEGNPHQIIDEIADAANFLFMLADNQKSILEGRKAAPKEGEDE